MWWLVQLAVVAAPTGADARGQADGYEDPTAKWRMEASGWLFAGAESQYLGVLLQLDRAVYRSLRVGLPIGMAGSLGVGNLGEGRSVNRLIVRGGPEVEGQFPLPGRWDFRGTLSFGGIYIRSSAFNDGTSLAAGFDSRITAFASVTSGPVFRFGRWEAAFQVELMLTPESTDEAFPDVPSRLGPWWLGTQISIGHRFGTK